MSSFPNSELVKKKKTPCKENKLEANRKYKRKNRLLVTMIKSPTTKNSILLIGCTFFFRVGKYVSFLYVSIEK